MDYCNSLLLVRNFQRNRTNVEYIYNIGYFPNVDPLKVTSHFHAAKPRGQFWVCILPELTAASDPGAYALVSETLSSFGFETPLSCRSLSTTAPSPSAVLVPASLPYLQMSQCPLRVPSWDLSSPPSSQSPNPVSELNESIIYSLTTTTCKSVASSLQMSNRHLEVNKSNQNSWYPHSTCSFVSHLNRGQHCLTWDNLRVDFDSSLHSCLTSKVTENNPVAPISKNL